MRPSNRNSLVLRLASIAAVALMLTSCGGSVSLDSRPVVELQHAAPPGALTAPCDQPSTLADGPMNAGPVARAWGDDRAALAGCAYRLNAIVDFYTERDKGLSSK